MNASETLSPATICTVDGKTEYVTWDDPRCAKVGADILVRHGFVDAVAATVVLDAEGGVVRDVRCQACEEDAPDIEVKRDRLICGKCRSRNITAV